MIAEKPVNYMSQEMQKHLASPAYALRMFQHPENIQAEEVLQDFLYFLEDDSDEVFTDKELDKIRTVIQEFLGYTIQQVKQAELQKLQQWKESVS